MKTSELNKAAEEYAQDETMSGLAERAFKAGAEWQRERTAPTCKSCGFYENNCPFIRDTFKPYPNKVCKDYTYSVMKEQPEVDLEKEITPSLIDDILYYFGVQSIDDMDREDLTEFARYFWNKGFNARKEE